MMKGDFPFMNITDRIIGYRRRLEDLVQHPLFHRIIIGLILINAVMVGLETYPSLSQKYSDQFLMLDRVLLGIFTLELILRILGNRSIPGFFRDPWNLFDFVLIVGSLLFVHAHFVTILRVLRVLRVLRALSVIPSLRRLVETLLVTIPSLGNILLLLGIFFYIFAVIGTFFFRDLSPEHFGSLHNSLLTLFQMVTLDSWASVVMHPLLKVAPWAWIYFVTFILIGTFVILNLFVGVIVNKVEKVEEAEREEEKERFHEELLREIRNLHREVQMLKAAIGDPGKKTAPFPETDRK